MLVNPSARTDVLKNEDEAFERVNYSRKFDFI